MAVVIVALVVQHGVQIILADHHYWGGLGDTRALATMCDTFGLGVLMARPETV
jgi:glucarate dehydratase